MIETTWQHHYSDPLIKAYLGRVGRVYEPKWSRHCPKCGSSGSEVAVRWMDGKMQLSCSNCRYEWNERPLDDIPSEERSWRWALDSLVQLRSSWAILGGATESEERKARAEADIQRAATKAELAESVFKEWISEHHSDLLDAEPDP